ncbi:MAG: von Willebrand factor type A domain-containing protein [Ruminiclostridium sp.]|nr:von Willebrand factor type A domain-containing protein [Ruminiclostridium sp.]
MFNKGSTFKMSEKQFAELRDFYGKLGYSDKQVKLLSENCFGFKVAADKSREYSPNWTFYPERELKEPSFPERMMSAMGGAVGGAVSRVMPRGMAKSAAKNGGAYRGAVMASADVEDGLCEDVAVAGAAAPAEPDEFSSAETKNPRENEPHSPMDTPQAIFSANVNSGSWSYLRNKISGQDRIDKSFVRIEEILNSYPYKLDPPDNGDLFRITAEYSDCPWNKDEDLLLVEMKAKKADASVKQNLVLLIDVSGSMTDNWVLVQMSAAAIMSNLKSGDTLSIISYSDNTQTVIKQVDCGDKDKCVDALLKVDGIGGCTRGSEGLENAYGYLAETYDKVANNRVFIFTDGDFNFGITSEGGLSEFIYRKRETGIYLSIVGYGFDNFKDNKMEALAQNGNGNYTFVSNPADILDNLNDKLISNLITVAKDVKISVELNPAYVSEYRLIGYDARQLTQKEFNDTEKAADGIGSEHNVVALIALKRGEAQRRYSTRYVTAKAEENKDEFAFIEVHYKSPDGTDLVYTKAITVEDIEHSAKDNIPAASMLAMFGLLVKESPYKGDASLDLLAGMIAELDKNSEISSKEPYGHFGIIRKYLFKR